MPTTASGHWYRTHVLRYLVALLNCRTRGNGFIPTLHVGILLHVYGLPFEARDPRPDCNVGNGILISHELATFEARIEHLVKSMSLFQIALFGIGRFAFVVLHKMMDLAEHGTGAAHLPHQPFDDAVAAFAGFGQQLAGLVREIDQNSRSEERRVGKDGRTW